MKTRLSTLILLLAAGLGFYLGRLWERRLIKVDWTRTFPQVVIKDRNLDKPEQVDFSLFWQVWQTLAQRYLDQSKLETQKMVYGAISGMVRSLGDPYTAFLSPDQNAQVKEQLEGIFEGVGIQIGFRDDRLTVISPLIGTPAEQAGIRAGDKVLAVDGEDTAGISLPEAQVKIRGPKGSQVILTILHHDETQPVEITITRETILIKSLEKEEQDGVVIFHLRRFSEQTPEEWDRLVETVVKSGGPKGVVVDVRDNPGGFLNGAVYVACEFIASGVVTKQERADGSLQSFRVDRQGKLLDLPTVVLINQGSASASEILAGSLKQLIGATLVGEKSFGKGTVQEVEELPQDTSLHITTSRWLLPDGKNIDGDGLRPDVEAKDNLETPEVDEALEKAVDLVKEQSR